MGVLNVTPDSFSDGGRYLDHRAAVAHGLALAAEGADLLDVGGESSRPGASYLDERTELDRVLPVIEALAGATDVPISIDTRKSGVAGAALAAGAGIVNDVTAGRDDPGLLGVAAEAKAPVVLMHMQGTPATMQDDPRYADVVAEVERFLAERCDAAEAAGVPHDGLVIDPGIGFGKRDEHNYALLAELARFTRLGHPVLVGTSRKGFIGRALGLPGHAPGRCGEPGGTRGRGGAGGSGSQCRRGRGRMTRTAAGDRILIRNLRVFGHHGVLPGEAEQGQVLVVDLDLALDLAPAGRSDELDRTVDYSGLATRVAELVARCRRRLIEAVAEDVAGLVLADERVREVRVRVTKPHAPLGVDAQVAVEVVRGRRGGDGP